MSNPTPFKVYLNGRLLPIEEAHISVMDRGFLFGDGVYEVIPCYNGRLFRLKHHLDRLDQSLAGIRMANPYSHDKWREVLEQLVAQAPETDLSVYLQVTRGATAKRDHLIPANAEPTRFAMITPIPPVNPKLAQNGIAAVTREDIRWQRCNIKSIALLANILLRQEAEDAEAGETLLIRDGLATEGSASNLFVITDGVIRTPPKSKHLLPGITRDLVLELARKEGLPWREEEIPREQLHTADEIWITSSTREIVPVTRLDGRPVGNGTPGPIFRSTHSLYCDYKAEIRSSGR